MRCQPCVFLVNKRLLRILIGAIKEENKLLNIVACKMDKKKGKGEGKKERKTGRLVILVHLKEEWVGKQGKKAPGRGRRQAGAGKGWLAEGATGAE